jgi:enterobactin synthetase component D
VASTSQFKGLGIDSERIWQDQVLEDGRSEVASPEELEDLSHSGLTEGQAVTALFCAKECLFKCLYPQVERFFDFHDAMVRDLRFSGGLGTFSIHLVIHLSEEFPAGTQGTGSFCFDEKRIYTALEWHQD